MKTMTVAVDDQYVKTLDGVIKSSRLYSSRSEFIKDAVREKMAELVQLNENLRDIRKASIELGKKARARGWDGSMPTREERDKAAKQFMEKKGIKH